MALGCRLWLYCAARGGDAACGSGAVLTPLVEHVAVAGSTNADLAERLKSGEGLPEGFWLRADEQLGGRGRRGRAWSSPAGNLYCSTIVHLRAGDPPAYSLSFVAALAVDDLLRGQLHIGGPRGPRLKWPNDVLVDGAKICGILLEQQADAVIVGIGINVAHAPAIPDRPTTAIQLLNPANSISVVQLMDLLAPLFATRVAAWRSAGLGATLAAWEERAHPRGTALSVTGEWQEPLTGTFAGLGSDGSLRLRLDDGSVRAIHAADVALI